MIAVFITDGFIRPFIGDVLVVILIYCFARTFFRVNYYIIALLVFAFACMIETLQYFNFVKVLRLERYKILAIALGSTFDWRDIMAYALGTTIIIFLENKTNIKAKT
ncbi:DUF2809 domain-containing protein [Nostoc sp. FACHB-110]|uniref:ribosomal maturation YjgA family protein n=1 Tax=Nostoc sp. FACHB-110 TaxID=2692834 RepID=UPI001F54D53A|nr:DUF2809 domain-containing protein [Nostoc sp. FACHB-110]